ncbi:hypothetical protein RRF57_011250 [Xylaria bambusicola]|uniref:Uncharacterized protein n=1 Tax=Xylaria bambusicola TaxID=326684 RepID=A0AAN7UXT4_9PEZI
MSTPAPGGGPVNPAALGVAVATLMMLSAYPGVCGGNMGEAIALCLPNMGEAKGLPYVEAVGDKGATSWWMGFGPFGNSHCVACVAR